MRMALVGGGTSGIGRAAAGCLARAGHRVVVTGRRPVEVPGLETVVSDLTDPAATAALFAGVVDRHGGVDVLVLNAGGPPPGPILALDDEAWQASFDLLLRGPLRLARLALPAMAERGFGRVVFITSTAVRQPQPDLAASVVLRAAVTSAAKLLSREYADRGVTVNCVAPGPTATERRRQILTARAERTGASYAEVDAADLATVPAGRAARPEEIGAAVAFLASEPAGFVNGTVLTVDGGRTETV